MKMTMSIDEALLARVLKLTGFKTKTEAVNFALKEAERNGKLTKYLASRELEAIDWGNSLDPDYDFMALRAAEMPPEPSAPTRGSR